MPTISSLSKHIADFTAASVALVMLGGFLLTAAPVQAAHLSTTLVSGPTSLTMQPGERKSITLEFQNTGSATWSNDGLGYISLYTHGPKYRGSAFDPGIWEWGGHPGRIAQAQVVPGANATLTFALLAPEAEGLYDEVFWLASEDIAWIDGGKVTISIQVQNETPKAVDAEEADEVSDASAELLIQSANSVTAQAGRSILLTAAFKNTGTTTWTHIGMVQPDLAIANTSVDFRHPSWSGTQLASKTDAPVPPGGTAVIDFSITAPQTNGTHTARFQFSANGGAVPDAYVELPVTVTGGSGAIAEAPVAQPIDQTVLDNPAAYIEEPAMRIGFLIVDEETDNEIVVTSVYSDFELRDANGTLLATRAKNQTVRAYYQNGLYYYDAGAGLVSSSLPLRFEPVEEHAVMRVANFDRRLTRSSKYADNEFRGVLELHYNDYKDRTWVINELSLEQYLRGLAETSNVSPMEYQKALVTAARTYAFYHYTHNSKYKKEFFHMSSYSWDQVYNGYGQEVRAPRITEAVEATRGALVTYEGAPVFTPYFSRSDGRTRAFNEVWNGSYPWLVSVSVPWDQGRSLWGHGVGLSAWAALDMANEDYTWDEILKHFYTGTELARKWQ